MARNFDLKRGKKEVVDLRQKSTPLVAHFKESKESTPITQRRSAVSTFWQTRAGDYSRLKRSPRRRSRTILTVLIILLFLLVIATAAGFFIFYRGGQSSDSVKLSLITPKAIASGEQLNWQLVYKNIDKVTLRQIEVIAEYPAGFFFDRANLKPTGSENNIWRLPDLNPGETGKIEVAGQLIGRLDEDKNIKVTFYYQPANFNSNFKTELETKVKISDVLFEVAVALPLELAPAAEAQFKVKYKNTTALAMENLKMSFELGDNFTLVGATPTPTSAFLWSFEKIEPESSGEVVLTGKYPETLVGEAPWQFKVWVDSWREGVKEERLLYQEEGKIRIVKPDLKVSLDFTNQNELKWGGELKGKVKLENLGQGTAENVALEVNFSSDVIDWDKFLPTAPLEKKGTSLVWSAGEGDLGQRLKTFASSTSEELVFSLPLKEQPKDLDLYNPEELMIEGRATVKFNFSGQEQTVTSEAKIAILAVSSQLVSEARYYLDAQTKVGSGPIPPVIGQETKYRIYWKVFSGTSGLNKVEVKTSLPPYINWVGPANQATLGTPLTYDEATRQVVWRAESFSATTQVLVSFDVSVVPTETQVNQLLILTNPTALSALEQGTNAVVSKTTNLLTSELLGDPVGQGKGRVVVSQ